MNALLPEDTRRVLCLGAHCDDIEIGCGGSIASALAASPDLEIYWCVLASNDERRPEAEDAARSILAQAKDPKVVVERFRESHFPWQGSEIKDFLESVKREFTPDVVLTHWRGDAHQDHRTVGELSFNAFRDQIVLEYEIPKWDGDMGRPHVFVPLSEQHARHKVDTLMRCFPSQRGRDWFTEDLFYALMRIRGMECRSPSGYAEAFHAAKLQLRAIAHCGS